MRLAGHKDRRELGAGDVNRENASEIREDRVATLTCPLPAITLATYGLRVTKQDRLRVDATLRDFPAGFDLRLKNRVPCPRLRAR